MHRNDPTPADNPAVVGLAARIAAAHRLAPFDASGRRDPLDPSDVRPLAVRRDTPNVLWFEPSGATARLWGPDVAAIGDLLEQLGRPAGHRRTRSGYTVDAALLPDVLALAEHRGWVVRRKAAA